MDAREDLTIAPSMERKDSSFSLSESDTDLSDIGSLKLVKTFSHQDIAIQFVADDASTFTLSSLEPEPTPAPTLRSSTPFIVFTVSYAIFVDVFVYDIFVPVLPFSLSSRFGVPEDHVQFWTSAFLTTWAVSYAISAPVCGVIADRLPNRRIIILVGLVLLSISTVLFCVVKSLPVMLVARVLQGISSGITWSAPLALVADVAVKDKIGQYMGYTTVGNCIAAVLAPILGGVLFERAGYYAVWIVNSGLIIIEIFLWLLVIEPEPAAVAIVYDPESATKACAISISTAETKAIATEGLAEQSKTAPEHHILTPILLLKSSRLLIALLCILITATLLVSFDSVLTIHVTTTFSWSSIAAGAAFIPLKAPAALSPIFGRLSDLYGPRLTTALGYIVLCVTFLGLSFAPTQDTTGAKIALCALLVAIGLAVNLTWCPLMGEITHAVDVVEATHPGIFQRSAKRGGGSYAQAYGLFTMAYAAGCAIGPVLAGSMLQGAGWNVMCWFLSALAGCAILPAVLFLGGWIGASVDQSTPEKARSLGSVLGSRSKILRGCLFSRKS